jgi:hypothetical protein
LIESIISFFFNKDCAPWKVQKSAPGRRHNVTTSASYTGRLGAGLNPSPAYAARVDFLCPFLSYVGHVLKGILTLAHIVTLRATLWLHVSEPNILIG